jgi:activator of HSP90 ATPase
MPRNVILAASLSATADRLFDMYLDPKAHAAFTGAPVTTFRAFDGMLSGTMLHVDPKRLIVQAWRSANWPADAIDSVLILSFWPEGDAARIELVHVNVPEEDFAGVSQGWEKYYWNPWREYLHKHPQ